MANYNTLKGAIEQVIKTNGNNEITGALLQQSLIAMINSLGSGYQFAGVAVPATNPGTPDYNVFYFAGPGTYPNFNNATIPARNIGLLSYNGTWHVSSVQTTPFSAQSIVNDIIQLYDGTTPVYPRTRAEAVFFDNDPTKTLDQQFSQLGQNIYDINIWRTEFDVPLATYRDSSLSTNFGSQRFSPYFDVAQDVIITGIKMRPSENVSGGTVQILEVSPTGVIINQFPTISGINVSANDIVTIDGKFLIHQGNKIAFYPSFAMKYGNRPSGTTWQLQQLNTSFQVAATLNLVLTMDFDVYALQYYDLSELDELDDRITQAEIDIYDGAHVLTPVYNEIDNCTNGQTGANKTVAIPAYTFDEAARLRYAVLGIASEVSQDSSIQFFSINSSNKVTAILKVATIPAGTPAGEYKILVDANVDAGSRVGIQYISGGIPNKGFGITSLGVGFSNGAPGHQVAVDETLTLTSFANYCYCLGFIIDEGEKAGIDSVEPLNNRVIAFIGDSFFDGGAGQGFPSNPYSVVKQIVEHSHIKEWYNFALGGACFCCDANTQVKQTEDRSQLYGDGPYPGVSGIGGSNVIINQVNRLIALVNSGDFSAPDMVVIMAGTNDRVPVAADPANLGSVTSAFSVADISGYTLPQLNTVALGARGTIEKLIDNFPNATLIVATPCYLKDDGAASINEVLEGVFEYMGVGCFRTQYNCGVNVRYGTHFPSVFLHDGLHPNVLGAKKIGNYLLGKMKMNASIV